MLLVRKNYVETIRRSASLASATVGGFHRARTATGDHGKTRFSEPSTYLPSQFIIWMPWSKPGRPEYRDRKAKISQAAKTVFKLARDSF